MARGEIKQEDLPTLQMMWDGYAEKKLLPKGITPDTYQYQALRRAFYNGASCLLQGVEQMALHGVPETVQTLQVGNLKIEVKEFFTAEAAKGRI